METETIIFFVSILFGIIPIVSREPKFLKELQEKNQNSGKCNIKDEECAKVFIQQHLISNLRNYYNDFNSKKQYMWFLIAFISLSFIAYKFFQSQSDGNIDYQEVQLAAYLFAVIQIPVLFMTFYLYIFSEIIKKYD